MTMFYTYIHTRKSDGQVFYVGKGVRNRATSSHGRSTYWARVSSKHGFVTNILAHWPTEEEAFLHEKFLIACFNDMHAPLVNMTLGGEGASGKQCSPETRKKNVYCTLGNEASA